MRDPHELAQPDRALIWDLDGTIADTKQDIATGVAAMLGELGRPVLPLDHVIRTVGRGVRVLVTLCLEQTGAPARDEAEIDEAVRVFREHYWRHLMDTTAPYPLMSDLLHILKERGRPMAVMSNKPEDATREILIRMGLIDCFAAVLGGDSLPQRKPSPEPIWRALRLCREAGTNGHDLNPDHAAIIGDSINDAQAGWNAGMPVCGVGWGFDPDGALRASAVDWWFERPAELKEALLGDV